MPFVYRWLVVGRVLVVEASGNLSLDEFKRLTQAPLPQQHETLPLHIIFSSGSITSSPDMRQLGQLKPRPNIGSTILVSDKQNTIVRFMASVTLQIMRINMRFAETIDDAIHYLKRIDPTLEADIFPDNVNTHPVLGIIQPQQPSAF